MKKFISALSLFLKPKPDEQVIYAPDESCGEFERNIQTRNPIIPFIYNNATTGEKIEVFLIEYEASNNKQPEILKKYEDDFNEQLDALKEEIGFECDGAKIITIPAPDGNISYRKLLKALMGIIDDYDVIFMDITFGKKPLAIVQFTALVFAYKIKKGVEIGAICYGDLHGTATDEPAIYDFSEFFLLADTMGNIIDFDDSERVINRIVDNLL